jgi:hypothetical protein
MSILTRRKLIGAAAFLLASGAYIDNNSDIVYNQASIIEKPSVEQRHESKASKTQFIPAESLESKIQEYRTSTSPAKKLDSLAGQYKFSEIIDIWNENQDILQGYTLDIDIVDGYKAAQIIPINQKDRAQIVNALEEMRKATEGTSFEGTLK